MKQILLAGGALILSIGVACAQTGTSSQGGNGGANGGNNVFSGHNAGPANNNVFSGHNAGPASNNVFSGHSTPGTRTAMNNTGNASGAPSAGASGGRMSNSQIEARLRNEGYSSFTHVKDHNGHFTANARRYGKSVNNLKVSETTGHVQNQSKLNDQQVKVLLAEKGYKDIAKVNNSNNHTMTAKAKMNGAEQTLYINSLTGNITRKS